MFIAKKFDELSAKEIYEILKARAAIFVVEQQIVYQDMDDRDFESLHVFCEENGIVTAYLRAFEVAPDVVKMGRVLTLQHGQGLGKKLLEFGLEEIKKIYSPKSITIDSQCHAIGFYEKSGFKVCSGEFLEEGIMHVKMELEMHPC
ncbi:MAG: GNAT family N-acetyltransferase [Lachnospiraceae bacterium]|nr:GNAT family N-acetyltransferase [Lachnospiraceae bacterium]